MQASYTSCQFLTLSVAVITFIGIGIRSLPAFGGGAHSNEKESATMTIAVKYLPPPYAFGASGAAFKDGKSVDCGDYTVEVSENFTCTPLPSRICVTFFAARSVGPTQPLPPKAHPDEIYVVYNGEPPVKALQMRNRSWVQQFDLVADYTNTCDLVTTVDWEIISEAWMNESRQLPEDSFQETPLALFLQSDCITGFREILVRRLMDYMPIDARGQCLRTNNDTSRRGIDDREYKFMITIENSLCNDYISEKVYRAIIAGRVPIVYFPRINGSYFPDISLHVPVDEWHSINTSIINLADFSSIQEAAKFIMDVGSSYKKYKAFNWMKRVEGKERNAILKQIERPKYQLRALDHFQTHACNVGDRVIEFNAKRVSTYAEEAYRCIDPTEDIMQRFDDIVLKGRDRNCSRIEGAYKGRVGHSLLRIPKPKTCCSVCILTRECRHWSYDSALGNCYLYYSDWILPRPVIGWHRDNWSPSAKI